MQSFFLVQINFDALGNLAHPVLAALVFSLCPRRPELNHIVGGRTRNQLALRLSLLYISESVFTTERFLVLVLVGGTSTHHAGKGFEMDRFGFVGAHVGFLGLFGEAFFAAFDLALRVVP